MKVYPRWTTEPSDLSASRLVEESFDHAIPYNAGELETIKYKQDHAERILARLLELIPESEWLETLDLKHIYSTEPDEE